MIFKVMAACGGGNLNRLLTWRQLATAAYGNGSRGDTLQRRSRQLLEVADRDGGLRRRFAAAACGTGGWKLVTEAVGGGLRRLLMRWHLTMAACGGGLWLRLTQRWLTAAACISKRQQ